MAKQKEDSGQLQIIEVEQGQIDIYVVGQAPLVCNKLSEKAKHELLHPRGRLNSYQKQTNLKHDPIAEFNAAPHKLASGPTLLALPSTAFKNALSSAALELPGTKKAQIARLTYVENEYVSVYGIPKLRMAAVRNSDMNHTPDIRTTAILPEWAAKFTVTYVKPLITGNVIANLIAAAGLYIGVGDGRPEKGKLSFGRFRVTSPDNPEYLRIVKYGGRTLQEAAMRAISSYDEETAELLHWWDQEIKRRNFEKTADRIPTKKPNGQTVQLGA